MKSKDSQTNLLIMEMNGKLKSSLKKRPVLSPECKLQVE